MKTRHYAIALAAVVAAACSAPDAAPTKMITPVKFAQVSIDDSFWSPRLEKHKNVTLGVCIDQIENQTDRKSVV